jgi:hypothetical protein
VKVYGILFRCTLVRGSVRMFRYFYTQVSLSVSAGNAKRVQQRAQIMTRALSDIVAPRLDLTNCIRFYHAMRACV